jgi:selenocysteine-specific elongation factor
MFIMGTAGHIDHGKSTLVTALTGINPDRLQEEQARGMTVDLGFAWFDLPRGSVGVVDVPGHHRLVKNMLAGVGLVDFVLLVIAADDGWMPQTQEHVDILHLYGIDKGVVALTKADLVDPEWLELVQADVEERLAGTSLQGFPIIPVSAVSGFNVDVLKAALNDLLDTLERDEEGDNPLLWIDRVFTIKGAGTVVTGTLVGGCLEVGMDVVVEPENLSARIRGLQTHTQAVEKGVPHSRLAVNLTGLQKTELSRGMYLCLPHRRPHFSLINSFVRVLPLAPAALATGQQVKLHVGTLETLAKVRVLGRDELNPGTEGFVQLELESPAHFSFQDRFILRHSELQENMGGGVYIEEGIPVRGHNMRLVGPDRLRRLFPFEKPVDYLNLDTLKAKYAADSLEYSLLKAADRTFWPIQQFKQQGFNVHPQLHVFGEFVMAPQQFGKVQAYLVSTVEEYHTANPLSPGPSKETLRAATGLPARLFDQILRETPSLQEVKGSISSSQHQLVLSPQEEKELTAMRSLIAEKPYEPPTLSGLQELGYSKELIYAAAHLGLLVALANEHWTTPEIVQQLISMLFEEEVFQNGFELGVFRDRLGTSRKFALAFLEYFDAQGITKRKGDVRTLGRRP